MRRLRGSLAVLTILWAAVGTSPGQTSYKVPLAEVAAILDAPPPPQVVMSPRATRSC